MDLHRIPNWVWWWFIGFCIYWGLDNLVSKIVKQLVIIRELLEGIHEETAESNAELGEIRHYSAEVMRK